MMLNFSWRRLCLVMILTVYTDNNKFWILKPIGGSGYYAPNVQHYLQIPQKIYKVLFPQTNVFKDRFAYTLVFTKNLSSPA